MRCLRCDGSGEVECPECDGSGFDENEKACGNCSDFESAVFSWISDGSSSGKITCPRCDGNQEEPEDGEGE